MKIEMERDSAIALENMSRYIRCIIPEKNPEITIVRHGRKALCKALNKKYDLKDECDP